MQYNIRVAEVIRAISRAADVSAGRPYGFSQRVAAVALELAQTVGLSELEQGDLLLAGLLHAVGVPGVGGDLARMVVGNERPVLVLFPVDWLLVAFNELDTVRVDEDEDGAMTGTFLRHHLPMTRFPEISATWLEQAGMVGAAAVVAPLLERWDGRGYKRVAGAAIPPTTRVLSLAYQLTAVRHVARLDVEDPVVEDARDLLATTDWLEALGGVLFDPTLVPHAVSLWTNDGFWDEVDIRRPEPEVAAAIAGASPDPLPVVETSDGSVAPTTNDESSQTDERSLEDTNDQAQRHVDELLSMYVLGLHDVDGDVPGIDRHIDDLLFTEYQGFVAPTSPVLESWLTLLSWMSDAKAAFELGHCQRVATLARELGLVLNLQDSDIVEIYLAGLVYGLGRLALPSALLESALQLSDAQRGLIREYPRVTRNILAPLAALGDVVNLASLHAERMDGSGYPEGRQGDATPMGSRILAVADTFQALISDRPYRQAHARSRALAIIQAQSGFLFDGLVTDSLEAVARGQV